MTLRYLDFDYSEDEQGWGCFDAMASVPSAHRAALKAEVNAVLAWAHATFTGQQRALEDGGEWDYDLHAEPEPASTDANASRQTTTFTLSGTAPFCEALRQRFQLD